MAAALCVPTAASAWAQQATVKSVPATSTTVQQEVAAPSSLQPKEWSQQDIELAQARCAVLLKGLDVVVVPATPWREGECGTPAPMKLISIGKKQQVTLSPPVTLTCDMIAALHKWVERDLQPLARKHLGGPLVRIDAMSSYSCRNAYGRAKNRLSEHGRVNALDIGAFVGTRGQTALVVADWGLTAREIAAQAAAAKATDTAAQSKLGTADQPEPSTTANHTLRGPVLTEPGYNAFTVGIPGITIQLPGGSSGQSSQTGSGHMGFAPANRLGGPKAAAGNDPGPAQAGNGKMDFLRAAHRSACRIFGTVLGPEANNAHKNHFHVDMADRKGVTICE
jgi:hypothetical protein